MGFLATIIFECKSSKHKVEAEIICLQETFRYMRLQLGFNRTRSSISIFSHS